MTLSEKLRYLEENHPELYQLLCLVVPDLVNNPEEPQPLDVKQYNSWVEILYEAKELDLFISS